MRLLTRIMTIFVIALSFNAHASIISGDHTTAGGKTVNLQGLEWLSFDHTMGLSRTTIEGASGWTDNYATTYDADSWRYATRAETSALLQSLWDGTLRDGP